MSPAPRTRGPLPARVYWVRRGLVLGTALALVFAIAQVFGGSDGTKTPDRAVVTSGKSTPTKAPTTAPTKNPGIAGPVVAGGVKTGAANPTGTPNTAELIAPDGPCAVDDITVTPKVATLNAGSAVPLTLLLTGIRPACTFTVSPQTLVAKVTAGKYRLWSSQDCPRSIPNSTVVVRSGLATEVRVNWSGRKSAGQCSRTDNWVMPGRYRVFAAAIGSEPSQAIITLVAPPRQVITTTVQPKPTKGATAKPTNGATTKPTGKPTPAR